MSRISWRGVFALLVLTVALVWFDACGLASRSVGSGRAGRAAAHPPPEISTLPAI